MAVRNSLFNLYFSLTDHPTLRFMAQETGLEATRIYRIKQQNNLKVEEWKKLSSIICAKLGLEQDLLALAEECLRKLEADDLQHLLSFMEQSLFYAGVRAWAADEVAAEEHCVQDGLPVSRRP